MKKNILILATVFCLGCELSIDIERLPGRYNFNTQQQFDSLFIYDNNRYLHKFTKSNGEHFLNEGSWTFLPTNHIKFNEFIFFNEQGSVLPAGLWTSKVKDVDGEIRLMYSAENETYFEKIDSLLSERLPNQP